MIIETDTWIITLRDHISIGIMTDLTRQRRTCAPIYPDYLVLYFA